uniref:Uncharacterized protein n=1 Tax=viral metagenome TaxID=1070528 RepID=A0A6C0AUM5_9ZZZZ
MPLTRKERVLLALLFVLVVAAVVIAARTPSNERARASPNAAQGSAAPPLADAALLRDGGDFSQYSVWNALQPAYPSGVGHLFEEFGYVDIAQNGAHYTVSFDVVHDGKYGVGPGLQHTAMTIESTGGSTRDTVEYDIKFLAVAYITRTGYFYPGTPSNTAQPMFRTVMKTGIQVWYTVSVSNSTPLNLAPDTVTPKRVQFTVADAAGNPTDLAALNNALKGSSGPSSNGWALGVLQQAIGKCEQTPAALQGVDVFRRSYQVIKPGQNSWNASQDTKSMFGMTAPHGHISVSVMDVITGMRARGLDSKNTVLAYLPQQTGSGTTSWPRSVYDAQAKALRARIVPKIGAIHSLSLNVRGVQYKDLVLYAALAKDQKLCDAQAGSSNVGLYYAFLQASTNQLLDFAYTPFASLVRWARDPRTLPAMQPVSVGAVGSRNLCVITPGKPRILYGAANNGVPAFMISAPPDIDVQSWINPGGFLHDGNIGGPMTPVTYAN